VKKKRVGKPTKEVDGDEKNNEEELKQKGDEHGENSGLAMRNYWIEYYDSGAKRWICKFGNWWAVLWINELISV